MYEIFDEETFKYAEIITGSIKVDLKRNNSHLKKKRRKDNGNGERKWTKTVWRGIKKRGVVTDRFSI